MPKITTRTGDVLTLRVVKQVVQGSDYDFYTSRIAHIAHTSNSLSVILIYVHEMLYTIIRLEYDKMQYHLQLLPSFPVENGNRLAWFRQPRRSFAPVCIHFGIRRVFGGSQTDGMQNQRVKRVTSPGLREVPWY